MNLGGLQGGFLEGGSPRGVPRGAPPAPPGGPAGTPPPKIGGPPGKAPSQSRTPRSVPTGRVIKYPQKCARRGPPRGPPQDPPPGGPPGPPSGPPPPQGAPRGVPPALDGHPPGGCRHLTVYPPAWWRRMGSSPDLTEAAGEIAMNLGELQGMGLPAREGGCSCTQGGGDPPDQGGSWGGPWGGPGGPPGGAPEGGLQGGSWRVPQGGLPRGVTRAASDGVRPRGRGPPPTDPGSGR